MTKTELQDEIKTLHIQLGETTLRLLEGMVIVSQEALIRVIRERQLKMALEALRYLRDEPTMTGWEAHIVADKVIKDIYAVTENIDGYETEV